MVFGFTVGATEVLASDDHVDADDSVDITVVPDEGGGDRGSGYPRVLISEIDPDPDTGEDVTLSPDDPPVYQRVHDVERNIWWINSAAPLARLYLAEPFGAESREWRIYHIERYIDVIVQIAMSQGPEADETMDVGDWTRSWGERASEVQIAASFPARGADAKYHGSRKTAARRRRARRWWWSHFQCRGSSGCRVEARPRDVRAGRLRWR
jgi:hypothetical protein